MKRPLALNLLAIAFLTSVASAQEKPNFTGRWTIQVDSAARGGGPGGGGGGGRGGRAGDMGSGWGSTITIAQDARLLTVEYAFFGRGDMQPPLKFRYALDGSETRNSVMMGRGVQVQASRAVWAGDQLVITTQHPFQHPETGQTINSVVERTLSLESPTSLVVATTRAGVLGGPASTTRTVYTKN